MPCCGPVSPAMTSMSITPAAPKPPGRSWTWCCRILRDGDVLVVTRLDRLGRSVLHLVNLGAQLRDRGVGLQVMEQGINTATAEGRAMFGMLSVLAELQRELIVANTRDGLAAARARGRRGGRPPQTHPGSGRTGPTAL